jgi:hypothetical protein
MSEIFSENEKGTPGAPNSGKKQLLDSKIKQYKILSDKLFKVTNVIPKTTFIIKISECQFKINLIKP